jgi:ribose 5-phosphate isomerase B
MKLSIACDHGALALKNKMVTHLQNKGYEVVDFGTHTLDSCDYPDFAAPAAQAVAAGECEKGIVLCTTGIGVSITANKVNGIRCALLSDVMSARLTREHNDTNMMAIGAAVVGQMLAFEIIDTWLGTEFSHNERHQRRIDKVMALEQE